MTNSKIKSLLELSETLVTINSKVQKELDELSHK